MRRAPYFAALLLMSMAGFCGATVVTNFFADFNASANGVASADNLNAGTVVGSWNVLALEESFVQGGVVAFDWGKYTNDAILATSATLADGVTFSYDVRSKRGASALGGKASALRVVNENGATIINISYSCTTTEGRLQVWDASTSSWLVLTDALQGMGSTPLEHIDVTMDAAGFEIATNGVVLTPGVMAYGNTDGTQLSSVRFYGVHGDNLSGAWYDNISVTTTVAPPTTQVVTHFFADFEDSTSGGAATGPNLDAGTPIGTWLVSALEESYTTNNAAGGVASFGVGKYTNVAALATGAALSNGVAFAYDMRTQVASGYHLVVVRNEASQNILQLAHMSLLDSFRIFYNKNGTNAWYDVKTSLLPPSADLADGLMDSFKIVLYENSFTAYVNDTEVLAGGTYSTAAGNREGKSVGNILMTSSSTGAAGWYDNMEITTTQTVDAVAAFRAHALFQDSMVLQRDMDVPVWGWAPTGTTVTVKLDGNTVGTATADSSGKWLTRIGSHADDGGVAHTLTLSCAGEPDVVIADVVFGDVYLASGQSNMNWTMANLGNTATGDVATANYPLIRQVAIAQVASTIEVEEPQIRLDWTPCSPSTAPDFSAVGYFFARNIHTQTGVPVGLLLTSWGGQKIERFLCPEGVEAVPGLAGFQQNQEHGGIANVYDIFNTMIAPLVPYGLCGSIWYQGEANAASPGSYEDKMVALMRGWRQRWGLGDFPFYYAQLANYITANDWPGLRMAQLGALAEPHSGMAVLIDIGNDTKIHPDNKQDAGFRLARWSLANDYLLGGAYSGPLYHGASVEGSSIRLLFDHAESGLIVGTKDSNSTNAVVPNAGPLQNFEIAGANGIFTNATAVIDADTVLVSSPSVASPAYVRYCHDDAPTGANKLYNADGLPASPFRTDVFHTLTVASGSGSAVLEPGEQQVVVANAPGAGLVFDRWIGAASEIDDPNASSATITMPSHDVYLLASYRAAVDPVYTLTVSNGFGSGISQAGSVLNIEADVPATGWSFDHWSGDTQYVIDASASSTTLRMPAADVDLMAVYVQSDTVGDGIADAWRATYFGGDGSSTNSQSAADADPDEDGATNGQEYIAGTSPTDGSPVLKLQDFIIESGQLGLSFPTVPGRRYLFEKSDSLVPPDWTTVLYNIAGDGMAKELTFDLPASSNAFFRIRAGN
ncbi:MAG: hypothetical protein K9L89_08720 [Kiritimatiellales bacterium]|nr:hypothetical protein [Kiritimatiellales bacterium]